MTKIGHSPSIDGRANAVEMIDLAAAADPYLQHRCRQSKLYRLLCNEADEGEGTAAAAESVRASDSRPLLLLAQTNPLHPPGDDTAGH